MVSCSGCFKRRVEMLLGNMSEMDTHDVIPPIEQRSKPTRVQSLIGLFAALSSK